MGKGMDTSQRRKQPGAWLGGLVVLRGQRLVQGPLSWANHPECPPDPRGTCRPHFYPCPTEDTAFDKCSALQPPLGEIACPLSLPICSVGTRHPNLELREEVTGLLCHQLSDRLTVSFPAAMPTGVPGFVTECQHSYQDPYQPLLPLLWHMGVRQGA